MLSAQYTSLPSVPVAQYITSRISVPVAQHVFSRLSCRSSGSNVQNMSASVQYSSSISGRWDIHSDSMHGYDNMVDEPYGIKKRWYGYLAFIQNTHYTYTLESHSYCSGASEGIYRIAQSDCHTSSCSLFWHYGLPCESNNLVRG